ncbi:hypothetical protein [Rhizobium bangladeshense]|uniref:hypothetical protein n=1 Tax=Rhizobium bangladeshense TaxID=1138189 RepID=UPI001C83ACF9|nr:hypothetical protein [Rhizobium bangladeshense]MBX4898597.1 hypothetical protein [Rhizobium bangladeshense]MBY3616620.1 hypothetical protein [Rhizobium bangladeshense]
MMHTRKQHERDTQQAIAEVQQIGARLARTIMETVSMTGDIADIDKGLEGAVADFRKLLVEGGLCDHDVDVSIEVLRRAIIAEGKLIAMQTHDVGRRLQ